jgi:hypothetical protein
VETLREEEVEDSRGWERERERGGRERLVENSRYVEESRALLRDGE